MLVLNRSKTLNIALSSREVTSYMLSEITSVLQACLTLEEAYQEISRLLPPLFPDLAGRVFIINHSRHLVEAVASWNSENLATNKIFTPDECWALRWEKTHCSSDSYHSLHCRHLHANYMKGEALCVPLITRRESFGTLYLSSTQPGKINSFQRQLALNTAEHIAVGLANLRNKLERPSICDPLTGLFNLTSLEEALHREIKRAESLKSTVGIVMLNLDSCQKFNQTFGQKAGYNFIRDIGLLFQKNLGDSHTAYRYGSNEFILIMPDAYLEATQGRGIMLWQDVKDLLTARRPKLAGVTGEETMMKAPIYPTCNSSKFITIKIDVLFKIAGIRIRKLNSFEL